jgi:hypothetical protein
LEARIKGGNKDVSFNRNLTLDGSASVDPDVPSSGVNGMGFEWKCSIYDPDGLEYPCVTAEGILLQLDSSPKISVPAGKLRALEDTSYWFTLIVSKPGKLSVTATVFINIYPTALPDVDLQIPLMFRDYVKPDGSISLRPSVRFALQGSCSTSEESVQFLWSLKTDKLIDPQSLSQDFVPLGLNGPNLLLDFEASSGLIKSNFLVSLACIDSGGTSTASIQVSLSYPPSGGSCSACLDGTSEPNCVKTGNPLSDYFKLSCSGWSSENLPLLYSFGYKNNDVDEPTTWMAYASESSVEMMFPTGKFLCKAMVKDSLGSETSEITDNGVISTTGDQRRDLSSTERRSLLDNAFKVLQGSLLAKDSLKVDALVAAISREVDSITNDEFHNISMLWRWELLSALSQELKFVVVNQEFVCGALDRAALVASSTNLTDDSLTFSAVFARMLIDTPAVMSIDTTCMSSAMAFYASAVKGVSQMNARNKDVVEILLNNLEPFVLSCANKFGFGMLPGESRVVNSQFSITEIHRLNAQGLASRNLCKISQRSMICDNYKLGFAFPSTFHSLAGLQSDDVVDVLLHGYSNTPAVSGGMQMVVSSPIVGLSLQFANGTGINVSNLTDPINITFSVPRPLKASCVFWNSEKATYSSEFVETVRTNDSDICQTRHLSLFGLAESGLAESKASSLLPTTTNPAAMVGAPYNPPGLEGLGLTILVPTQCFSPSSTSNQSWMINSSKGPVQIVVPAGSWPQNKTLQTSFCVTVVNLSSMIKMPPGTVDYCSIAVDFTPRQFQLNAGIELSLPCTGNPLRTNPLGYLYDFVGRIWVKGQNQMPQKQTSASTWLSISELTLHAVFFSPIDIMLSSVSDSTISTATIATIAAVGGTACLISVAVFLFLRRKRQGHISDLSGSKASSVGVTVNAQNEKEGKLNSERVEATSDSQENSMDSNSSKRSNSILYSDLAILGQQAQSSSNLEASNLVSDQNLGHVSSPSATHIEIQSFNPSVTVDFEDLKVPSQSGEKMHAIEDDTRTGRKASSQLPTPAKTFYWA